MNILDMLTDNDKKNSNISRRNAKKYASELLKAISLITEFQSIANKEGLAEKKINSDCILQTEVLSINGVDLILKMSFSHEDAIPQSAEIIKDEP